MRKMLGGFHKCINKDREGGVESWGNSAFLILGSGRRAPEVGDACVESSVKTGLRCFWQRKEQGEWQGEGNVVAVEEPRAGRGKAVWCKEGWGARGSLTGDTPRERGGGKTDYTPGWDILCVYHMVTQTVL